MNKKAPAGWLLAFLIGIGAAGWLATRRAPAARFSPLPTNLLARHTGPIEFDRVPLREAVDRLASRTRSTIIVSWWQMQVFGIHPSDPVRIGFGDVSLDQALQFLFLRDGQVGVWEHDGLVYVTSAGEDTQTLDGRAYDISDLVVQPPEPGTDPLINREEAVNRLYELAIKVVNPESRRLPDRSLDHRSIRMIGDVMIVSLPVKSRDLLGHFLDYLRAARGVDPAAPNSLRGGIDVVADPQPAR